MTNVGTHLITPRLSCSPGCDLPTFVLGKKNTRPESHVGRPPNGISLSWLWGRPHEWGFVTHIYMHESMILKLRTFCSYVRVHIVPRFVIARRNAGMQASQTSLFLFSFINFFYEKWISIFNYLPWPGHPLIRKKISKFKKHWQLWMAPYITDIIF